MMANYIFFFAFPYPPLEGNNSSHPTSEIYPFPSGQPLIHPLHEDLFSPTTPCQRHWPTGGRDAKPGFPLHRQRRQQQYRRTGQAVSQQLLQSPYAEVQPIITHLPRRHHSRRLFAHSPAPWLYPKRLHDTSQSHPDSIRSGGSEWLSRATLQSPANTGWRGRQAS